MNKIGQPRLGHGQMLGRQWRTRINNLNSHRLAYQKNKFIIMISIRIVSTSLFLHLAAINRLQFQGHQHTGHWEFIPRTLTLSALSHLLMLITLLDLQAHLFISRRYLLVILLLQVIFTWHIGFACEACVPNCCYGTQFSLGFYILDNIVLSEYLENYNRRLLLFWCEWLFWIVVRE